MYEHSVNLGFNSALERATKFTWFIDSKPDCFASYPVGSTFAGFELCLIQMQIVKQRDRFNSGDNLLDKLNPLPRDFRRIEKDPRHIAARSVETLRRPIGSQRSGSSLRSSRDRASCPATL